MRRPRVICLCAREPRMDPRRPAFARRPAPCRGIRFPEAAAALGKTKMALTPRPPRAASRRETKRGTAGTFVAWSRLLAMSRSPHRAGEGPGPARPPSQFPREASSSVCSGTGSPPVTVTGTARAVCVSARRGARRCGNREPGPREASGVPQATVSSDHEGSAARAPLGRGSPLPGGTVALRTRCFLPCVGSCCQGPFQWPVPSPHLTVSIPHEGWLPSCPFQGPP